jgi:phenylalanyl-tRNA synthetase alpha chain
MMSTQQDNPSLEQTVSSVKDQFQKELQDARKSPNLKTVDAIRVAYLGKKGSVTALMTSLREAPPEQRPALGKIINELRTEIESAIQSLKEHVEEFLLQEKLNQQTIDLSLPVAAGRSLGSLHPVTLMRKTVLREFRRLGFTVVDGPETDLDFYNFSALNFKDDHPARDMQDTFFLKNKSGYVLRTHTSNIQIHAMLDHRPPLRIVAPGRTFRCDSDLTHTPMFHQIECFVVDMNITMSDMKGVIDRFLKAVYGEDLATRLRPSFFPFVEPGGEIDMQCMACRGKGCRICKETGWLEIGGLGMIHPNVFESVDYDSEKYTGFAFGFGLDRMAMLKYGLGDLRQLFEGNRDFLSQFPSYAR